jgi:hypothetical protein
MDRVCGVVPVLAMRRIGKLIALRRDSRRLDGAAARGNPLDPDDPSVHGNSPSSLLPVSVRLPGQGIGHANHSGIGSTGRTTHPSLSG